MSARQQPERRAGAVENENVDARPVTGDAVQLAAAEVLADLGTWSLRPGTAQVFCSAGFANILGLGDEPREFNARHLLRRVAPQHRSAVIGNLRSAFKGNSTKALEFELLQPDGPPSIIVATIRPGDRNGAGIWGICRDVTAAHRVKAALERSESRWEMALESAGQGVWDSDLVTGVVYHSRTWRAMRGMNPDQDAGDTHEAWLTRVHPDDIGYVQALIAEQHLVNADKFAFEYRERHADGHYIWISSFGAPVEWFPNGLPKRIIGTDTDVTVRKNAEATSARLSRRLEMALEVTNIGVFEANLSTGELYWDERVRAMYGKPADNSPIGPTDWEQSLHPDDSEAAQYRVNSAVANRANFLSEFRIIRPDGEIRTLRTWGTHYVDLEGTPRVLGANWDVTEEVAAKHDLERARDLAEMRYVELEAVKARIEHNSLHDTLTGLPNRRYLDEVLATRAAWCRDTGGSVGLLHIDLDRFKQINDTLGHVAGDAMLIHAARLLEANLMPGDFVARVGGDEFIVVCSFTGDASRLDELAASIIEQMRRPVPYDGHYCRFGASIGIAVKADAAVDPMRLLIDADIALYRAKGRGKNRFELFTAALQAETESAKRLADDILRGIEQNEFIAYYQPLFSAQDFSLVGVEALARWSHPTLGILAPAAFLKVAEDLNVVPAIDRAILELALRDFDRWGALGLSVPAISVNTSFTRLRDPELIQSLKSLDIRPGILSFELLESIFLDEPDEVVSWNIDQIKDLGIDISIDDFGTGHASVVSLLKLRPRRLKLDRQFMDGIVTSTSKRNLVSSLIHIGKSLGIEVVAEGVETMGQARALRKLGCDFLQGYAFARPMDAEKLEHFIRVGEWRAAG